MSLTETNLLQIAKKQYAFKLEAYMGIFFTLIVVQALGILFSMNGIMSSGTTTGEMFVSAKVFAGDMIITLTMIWVLFLALNMTIDDYRRADFVFVTNRLSSNLSSIGFVLTAALVGGVTASFGGVITRVLAYYSYGSENIASQHFFILPQELLMSIMATTLYIILISAIGYFFGTLIQIYRGFIIILPTIFIGLVIMGTRGVGNIGVLLPEAVKFFTNESSLVLFAIKVIVTALVLFYSSILISNRLEV
ncbi:hypothetical protein GGQ84_001493 [Desulfitispora alkaliphila]